MEHEFEPLHYIACPLVAAAWENADQSAGGSWQSPEDSVACGGKTGSGLCLTISSGGAEGQSRRKSTGGQNTFLDLCVKVPSGRLACNKRGVLEGRPRAYRGKAVCKSRP